MKPLAGMALAILIGAAPAHAGRDVLNEKSTRTLEVGTLHTVRVENRSGDVVVTRSPDARIHVVAVKTVRSGSRAESLRLARDLHVDLETTHRELAIQVRSPSRRSIRIGFWDLFQDFEVPNAEIRLEVGIPPGLALAVRSSSGDVRTEGLANTQQLDASSGDIEIADAAGTVRVGTHSGRVEAHGLRRAVVRTASGDIDLDDARGPLDLRTGSGDLSVRGATDSLIVATVSGDIEIRGAERGLQASTTSGAIDARDVSGAVEVNASSGRVRVGMRSPREVNITTGSGDIVLTLGRGVGARLELQTSNGSLEMDSPIAVTRFGRRRLEGTLRHGGPPMVLRSASGDIHVKTGESES